MGERGFIIVTIFIFSWFILVYIGQNLFQSTLDCINVIIKQFNERPVLQNEIPGDLTDDDWKALLAKADKDNNGKISIEEYKENGASSLTVTTVWLGIISTMWLLW